MDIRQLQYYREIVRQGNITKAAEALNIAQPPLSQLLKQLESELGTVLIHRYRQKWEVTESGRLLYEYAEQMLSEMDDVKRQITEIEAGSAGTVRIGVSSACSNLLIRYIAQFREAFPKIRLDIVTGDSEGLLIQLMQRKIDLALLLMPADTENFETKALKTEPAILITPNQWAGALSEKPTFHEIARLPFIMLGPMEGYSFHSKVINTFDVLGLEPNIIAECKDIPLIVSLVNRGIGISIIPRMHYSSPFFDNLNIYELPQIEFQVKPVLMKLKAAPTSRAAEQFWEMVE
ncbi:HTH-type transcriptional regulator gltC [Bhargavaea cecembensis DSE10]|uniref:HTH-type transcriptional regulator gltC n=1 Tax=Bhargavaea cecembensis DSE10 TaxID=1235279 RepID=M7P939_9BACL|nr:LysR family transcriptional regulator [Bhargavaea cecembensis]EMR07019.1 HTH-type transcriptional regulator gltC [Bhargavaea cecembensis DSE10]